MRRWNAPGGVGVDFLERGPPGQANPPSFIDTISSFNYDMLIVGMKGKR
jgi:hypothetical protein